MPVPAVINCTLPRPSVSSLPLESCHGKAKSPASDNEQELPGLAPQKKTGLVGEVAVHNEGHDFHVAVGMLPEAALRLHEVIVHDAEDTKAAGAGVLGKAEVEAGLEPVLVGPPLIHRGRYKLQAPSPKPSGCESCYGPCVYC